MMLRPGAGMTSARDARVLFSLAGIVGVIVFVIDALTPLDIAIAVLYVVVVLLVASTGLRHATIATGCACAALTVIAFLMSHDENYSGGSIARGIVSLLAIGTTSFLALRNQANTVRLQE